jgi:DNA-3-methyladenine glycosylase
MNFELLAQAFYAPSAETVAPRLLGHWLLRRTADGVCGGPIVETEAYLFDDPACHAARGETVRNRTMFGPPGGAYVYFIYGNYFCVNAVCRPRGHGEAVLIRAVEAEFGADFLRANRTVKDLSDLTNGPGKLCAAMKIDRSLDGAALFEETSPLMIARNPRLELFRKERGPIVKTTRIGITKAAHLPLRFYLEGSPFVSKRIFSKLRARSRSGG